MLNGIKMWVLVLATGLFSGLTVARGLNGLVAMLTAIETDSLSGFAVAWVLTLVQVAGCFLAARWAFRKACRLDEAAFEAKVDALRAAREQE